eukprot:926075_1
MSADKEVSPSQNGSPNVPLSQVVPQMVSPIPEVVQSPSKAVSPSTSECDPKTLDRYFIFDTGYYSLELDGVGNPAVFRETVQFPKHKIPSRHFAMYHTGTVDCVGGIWMVKLIHQVSGEEETIPLTKLEIQLPGQWQWLDAGEWKDYFAVANCQIGRHLQNGDKTVSIEVPGIQGPFDIDLVNNKQISTIHPGRQHKIRRDDVRVGPSGNKWQWEKTPGQWEEYDPKAERRIERLYQSGPDKLHKNVNVLDIGSNEFNIDFVQLMQISPESGPQYKMRRVPACYKAHGDALEKADKSGNAGAAAGAAIGDDDDD